jgi:2-polyprenyl-3-methyl-5-hydroxy-6-metoxy-1,4-benzoquinol methylase
LWKFKVTSEKVRKDPNAQKFWLSQMRETNALNLWVFSQFKSALGHNILEVGCGTGNFTVLIGEAGTKVLGVDIDEVFVKTAQAVTDHLPGVTIENRDITKSDWNAEFDTVVMLDVLEHLVSDVEMLERLWGALAPGGRLIIKAPALPGFFCPMDEAVGHQRRYTRRTLVNAIEAAGFSDPKCWAFNFVGIFGWWLNGSVLRRTTPPVAQLKVFNRLIPLLRTFDFFAPPGVGLSLIAIAERPNSQDNTNEGSASL